MEKILSEFNIANLDLKLTEEKLYIKTSSSFETFALRSINGIGVVDLIDKYNQDLTEYKKKRTGHISRIILGSILTFLGIIASGPEAIFCLVTGIIIIGISIFLLNNLSKPNMLSSVRIMMIGGTRDFEFDKTSFGSDKIAKFVANVESTLSAYHKSNS